MDVITAYVTALNDIVWGPPMLLLIGLTGLFLTIGLKFLPIRRIGYAFRILLEKEPGAKGEISPFQALMTALSATVGTGNIAGVATAIFFGGPGALFYMWAIALVGMATKYSEAVCAVTYREVDERGEYVGGPMYYLKNGVGMRFPLLGKVLGIAFALFAAVAAFGIGNGVQANSVAHALTATFDVSSEISGFVMMTAVALVIFGGIRWIADVASTLVPIMIVGYVGAALIILGLIWCGPC